ncbi:hypothetical protein [Paractinoplanes maris]|uniref:hypothetical protein n=1 Tax=Paractinoplanes maris TaxID=1734446 RepID=UPI003F693113
MAGSAREEAERLVASVLARAVTGQAFGERWATGEPECCVCPVCKAIAAMRDPSPQTAARLAGSAGDLAGSVAGLLRSVSAIVGERPRPAPPSAPAPVPNADQTWSTVTRAGRNNAGGAWAAATNASTGTEQQAESADPWSAATTASAASAAADHAAELAERRAVALQAAADAERRVAEAAALAKARREAAAAAGETGDTAGQVARDLRTPRRLDVWAAATSDAGVGTVAPGESVDHDVPGRKSDAASGDTDASGAGGAGDEARDGGAA